MMFLRVRNNQTNSVCPVCKGGKTRFVWRHLPELRFGIPDLFSVRLCVECGTCLTDPLPDQRYLEKIYQKNYVPAEYVPPDRLATVPEAAFWTETELSVLLQMCAGLRNKIAIDVGAEQGSFTAE